ncbi:CTP synthetase [Palleronia sp. KMU-117]|jgi:predicted PurR-regulated permease PerM|uniref:CTP synthetase n=1 Tax=Palleronia sp. KMU-117 TaxID=3434108 RepID=UPI003D706442
MTFHTGEGAMLPLMLIIHIFLGSTIAGSAIILALVLGYDTLVPIAIAGIAGFVLSFPVSWMVAKRLSD